MILKKIFPLTVNQDKEVELGELVLSYVTWSF